MRNYKKKPIQSIQDDNISITKCSESSGGDFTLLELDDSSITLYNTLQSMWSDYQDHLLCFPCLDILATLASQENPDKCN